MHVTLPTRPVVLTALLAMPLLAFAARPAAAQNVTTSPGQEREAVLAVVQAFFDTMASKDLPGAERVVMPEGRFYSVRQQDGKPVMRTFTNQEYLEHLPGRTQAVRERMWDPEVRRRGRIAHVWTPSAALMPSTWSRPTVDGRSRRVTDFFEGGAQCGWISALFSVS